MKSEDLQPPAADEIVSSVESEAQDALEAERAASEQTPSTEAMAAIAEELAALHDRYLRLAAEYDNFRKRTERERIEWADRAQAQLVEKLLEPLDDLQRVTHFTGELSSVDALLEGVQMVEKKLLRALESAGLEPLESRGQPFDPEIHEALMITPTEVAEEDDTVGEIFQNGYRFRGALLRPARVQVRKHGG